jgi:hypothetical protein
VKTSAQVAFCKESEIPPLILEKSRSINQVPTAATGGGVIAEIKKGPLFPATLF